MLSRIYLFSPAPLSITALSPVDPLPTGPRQRPTLQAPGTLPWAAPAIWATNGARPARYEGTPRTLETRPASVVLPEQLEPMTTTRRRSGLNIMSKAFPQAWSWRREWDSNPRYSCPYSGFQDRRLRPLGHPSDAAGRWCILFYYIDLRRYSAGMIARHGRRRLGFSRRPP